MVIHDDWNQYGGNPWYHDDLETDEILTCLTHFDTTDQLLSPIRACEACLSWHTRTCIDWSCNCHGCDRLRSDWSEKIGHAVVVVSSHEMAS